MLVPSCGSGFGCMIRVFLAGSSPLAIAGLTAMLRGDSELEIVGTLVERAESEETLSQAIAGENPDVVVLELSFGQEKAQVKRLAADEIFSDAAIVVISREPDFIIGRDAIRFGARAVLGAGASTAQLRAAIRAVAEGLIVLSDDARSFSSRAESIEFAPAEELESLTAREREVLNLMAGGLGNKQIAVKLRISEHTAKFHVASILGKLGATTRTEAVTIGVRNGLVLL
jgi:two-component system, NarL family, response regulator YdfI